MNMQQTTFLEFNTSFNFQKSSFKVKQYTKYAEDGKTKYYELHLICTFSSLCMLFLLVTAIPNIWTVLHFVWVWS